MKTTNGKLKNVTSGVLHTSMTDIHAFYEVYLGMERIFTHQLPKTFDALLPILNRKLDDAWFIPQWNKDEVWQNEPIEIPDLTKEEKDEFWKNYNG